VDAADDQGCTALHRAAKQGHTAVVQLLLAAQAAVDAADSEGETALHKAAQHNQTAVVQLLLDANAAVEPPVHRGVQP
jgi:ankyrin repeat protein